MSFQRQMPNLVITGYALVPRRVCQIVVRRADCDNSGEAFGDLIQSEPMCMWMEPEQARGMVAGNVNVVFNRLIRVIQSRILHGGKLPGRIAEHICVNPHKCHRNELRDEAQQSAVASRFVGLSASISPIGPCASWRQYPAARAEA